jgi:hypothetical protein
VGIAGSVVNGWRAWRRPTPRTLAWLTAGGALLGVQLVRGAPLAWSPWLYVDAVALGWVALVAGALALRPTVRHPGGAALALALAAACVPLVLLPPLALFGCIARGAPRRERATWLALAASTALIIWQGGWFSDGSAPPGAVSPVAFAGLVAAATAPLLAAPSRRAAADDAAPLVTVMWLVPLVRSWAYGPWDAAWSLLPLAIGAAGWWASAALAGRRPAYASERAYLHSCVLAGLGLASGAGMAAALLALLAALAIDSSPAHGWRATMRLVLLLASAWAMSGALVAGGAALVLPLVWLALGAMHLNRRDAVAPRHDWRAVPLTLLGVMGIMLSLLPATIEHLQAGLTVFGDLATRPWIGFALLDAARREVIAAPLLFMLALGAVMVAISALLPAASPLPEATAAPVPAVWWLDWFRRPARGAGDDAE